MGNWKSNGCGALTGSRSVDGTLANGGVPNPTAGSAKQSNSLDDIEDQLVFSRAVLPVAERHVVWLSVTCVLGLRPRFEPLYRAARQAGVTDKEITEIFLQCGLYAGFSATKDALNLSGLTPIQDLPDAFSGSIAEMASATKTRIHGRANSTGYADPSLDLMNELYSIVSDYGYGVIWQRRALSFRSRLICALAAFACLPAAHENLRKFARSAVRHGIERPLVAEVVIQTAPFCGFPTAIQSMGHVTEALLPQPDGT